MRIGLAGALTDHYGSPGHLADYRRQFEKFVRPDGEDPSKFAVTLGSVWPERSLTIMAHPDA